MAVYRPGEVNLALTRKGLIHMTEEEFAEFLRSLPRELPPERVAELERDRDHQRGPYLPHGSEVHHYSDESRH